MKKNAYMECYYKSGREMSRHPCELREENSTVVLMVQAGEGDMTKEHAYRGVRCEEGYWKITCTTLPEAGTLHRERGQDGREDYIGSWWGGGDCGGLDHLHGIVSTGLDADRMNYAGRDAHVMPSVSHLRGVLIWPKYYLHHAPLRNST